MEYEVKMLSMDLLYSDDMFNCRRGGISRVDVLDLMNSIKTTRLESPIVVQPIEEIVVITPPPAGVKYRVLNGNRRYTAYRLLGLDEPSNPIWKTIPAIIRLGLDDDAARALNVRDNLERLDLNLLQEAQALEKWHKQGYTRETVGRMINQSGSWVQIRFNLLELPPDLQEYAAKGMIGQGDVKDLYQYRTDVDKLYNRAKEIIQHRLRGVKPPRVRSKRQQARAVKPGRARSRGEIEEMMVHVSDNVGFGLVTRLMAWCAGTVSTFEIMAEVKNTGRELGNPYKPLNEDALTHL